MEDQNKRRKFTRKEVRNRYDRRVSGIEKGLEGNFSDTGERKKVAQALFMEKMRNQGEIPEPIKKTIADLSDNNFSKVVDRTATRTFSFGLSMKEFTSRDYTFGKSIKRGLHAVNPVGAAVRTDLLNSMGIATKAQKNMQRLFPKDKSLSLMRVIAPGVTAMSMYNAIQNDENPILAATASAIDMATIGFGFSAGKAIGATTGIGLSYGLEKMEEAYHRKGVGPYAGKPLPKSVGGASKFLRFGGAGLGATLGAVGALAVTSALAISDGIAGAMISTNEVLQMESRAFDSSEFTSAYQDNLTYTMRQRALSKMSMSGLNDRAMGLGNEALLYKNLL